MQVAAAMSQAGASAVPAWIEGWTADHP